MNKKLVTIGITLILISIGLSGCEELNTESENIETIEIESMGVVQTVNYVEKPVKLIVRGMDCVITVSEETNLTEVIIEGMNSIVRVSRSHSFTSAIRGMDARIEYYD